MPCSGPRDLCFAFPVKLLGDLEGVRVDLDDRIHRGLPCRSPECAPGTSPSPSAKYIASFECLVEGVNRDLVEFKIVVEILGGNRRRM